MVDVYTPRIKVGFRAIWEFSRKLKTTHDETLGGCLQTCLVMTQLARQPLGNEGFVRVSLTWRPTKLGKARNICGCVTTNVRTHAHKYFGAVAGACHFAAPRSDAGF